MPYLIAAVILAAASALVLWTAMRWPNPRADVTAALAGATAVALWSAFHGAHPGPTLGVLAFTVADVASLPALLVASLLMGRTVLLRRHPRPSAPLTPSTSPDAANAASAPLDAADDAAETGNLTNPA